MFEGQSLLTIIKKKLNKKAQYLKYVWFSHFGHAKGITFTMNTLFKKGKQRSGF